VSRVLLVEDEDLNRQLAKAVLARASDAAVREAEVVEAATLEAARTALAAGPIDVILLDVNLPDGNGLTLAADLSELPERPHVIALTASVLPHERAAAISAGCDEFLDKPYAPQTLVEVIGKYLRT
jgi:two-component system KDP operon response regulator KdpE